MKKLQKFNQCELPKKQLNSVKGGGWGNGGISLGKSCPPPDAGVWKRNVMS